MKTMKTLLAVASSVAALACGGPASDELDSAVAVKIKPLAWVFTGTPAAQTAIAAPATAFQAMSFAVQADVAKTTFITQMAFSVTGTFQAGDLANFQLVFFPDGLKKPGVVIGTNSGATLDPVANVVAIDLTTPFAVKKNLKAEFALLVDVNGTLPFTFTPQLDTLTLDVAAVQQVLAADPATNNLPLAGDTFTVN